MRRLALAAVFALCSFPSLAWIPPADLVYRCAAGEDTPWPNAMGKSYHPNQDACRDMVTQDIRSWSNPLNDPEHLLCLPRISDPALFSALMRYYDGKYPSGTNLTYMAVDQEALWDVFACSDEARQKHKQEKIDEKIHNDFLSALQVAFNHIAYGEKEGKNFCVPRTPDEYTAFAARHDINSQKELAGSDLTELLAGDYPCKK